MTACAVHVMTRSSSPSEGGHLVPCILHDSRPHMGREVSSHLRRRQRQVSLLPVFLNAREEEF